MNQNSCQFEEWAQLDCDSISFEELENQLESDLEEQKSDLEGLENDREKIGNPDTIGETVMNVVWEQFINQIGVIAGEDFIKENEGLKLDLTDDAHIVTIKNYGKDGAGSHNKIIEKDSFINANHGQKLDLSDDAHIQTSENFAQGVLATHNYKSSEQLEHNYKRYKNTPHKEFRGKHINPEMNATLKRAGELNKEGTETVTDIYTGRQIPTKTKLEDGSNNPNAAQREHVISSADAYNNHPALQMVSTDEQLAATINDPNNLQGYTTAKRNNRKSDNSADEMEVRDKNKHWEKANKKAEEHFAKTEKEGEKRLEIEGRTTQKEEEERSIEAGKKSQKEEAFRIGKTAVKAALMGLLASLVKDIIHKLIAWFRAGNMKLSTFLDSVKEAFKSFISNLKEHIINAGNTLITSITTAIFGPIIGTIKKAWIFLKQGYKSIKDAINYLKNPANKNLPFSIKMMEVGKIVIVGLTAGSTILLGEIIEKGLLTIPVFAVEIPLIGSLASIIGMFSGALVSGLIGALALNVIDKLIANRLKRENRSQQFDKKNDIIQTQEKLTVVTKTQVDNIKTRAATNIVQRHVESGEVFNDTLNTIHKQEEESNKLHESTQKANSNISNILNNLENGKGIN